MQIALHIRTALAPSSFTKTYQSDDDDIRSILTDVCDALDRQAEFVVTGFGQDRWPVDVRTDLCVFLEQLPFAIHAVSESEAVDIDFYEQGIGRTIAFTLQKNGYFATCTSRTRWQPDPKVEEIDCKTLEEMLKSVRDTFMQALGIMAPELVGHTWVRQWLRGMSNWKQ